MGAAVASDVTTSVPKSFAFWPTCHIGRGGRLDRNADNTLMVSLDVFDLSQGNTQFAVPSGQNVEVDVGDVREWPAVDITINSDIAVKFVISYPEEG